MVIEFSAAKDAINQKQHGLSLSVVEYEFTTAAIVLPAYHGSDAVRYKMMDMTRFGLLTAIVTPRLGKLRVISLRPANKQEVRIYEAEIR